MTNTPDLTCDELEEELKEALTNLYTPGYHPSAVLCSFFGCEEPGGAPHVRMSILRAIERLKLPAGSPTTAYTKQVYDLLYHRFVLRLTQEETADRLFVSRRTVNRLQHRAIHMLAGLLWECRTGTTPANSSGRDQAPPSVEASRQAEEWQSQVQLEVASLQRQAPDAVSDVREVINNVLDFLSHLPSERGVSVKIASAQPGLVAAVHPVVIRQILIAVIQRLAQKVSGGPLSIYTRLEDGDVRITLTGPIEKTEPLTAETFAKNVPVPAGITIETCIDHGHAFVWVQAPSKEKISVLIVDDNLDMARFYRDATIGTRYQITSLTTGQALLDSVDRNPPDIIVLDVMLPDIDGWRLLMRLHEDSLTRSIPVIVCSVVREEALAFSLGAAGYLAKPVRPREFIETLDRISGQRLSTAPEP